MAQSFLKLRFIKTIKETQFMVKNYSYYESSHSHWNDKLKNVATFLGSFDSTNNKL